MNVLSRTGYVTMWYNHPVLADVIWLSIDTELHIVTGGKLSFSSVPKSWTYGHYNIFLCVFIETAHLIKISLIQKQSN